MVRSQILSITVTPAATSYTVTFTVSSSTGPVAGASIVMGSFPAATTNATGTAVFPSVPAGTYPVSVTATGFQPVSQNVTVSANSTFTVTMLPVVTTVALSVLSATGGASGGSATIQSNLATSSGSKTIHYEVYNAVGAQVTVFTINRGWNPGEIITQAATWPTLPAGSYTLRVYVSDTTNVIPISNVLNTPFTV